MDKPVQNSKEPQFRKQELFLFIIALFTIVAFVAAFILQDIDRTLAIIFAAAGAFYILIAIIFSLRLETLKRKAAEAMPKNDVEEAKEKSKDA